MSANSVAKHRQDVQPMSVSSSSCCEGMDSKIRQLSIDTADGSSSSVGVSPSSSSSPWPIMSNLASPFALDQGPVQAVTPCPSDSSCCTDCGVSSSSSYTGMMQQQQQHPAPTLQEQHPGFTSSIPTEVQMTQQLQSSNHGNATPISPISEDANKPASHAAPARKMSEAEKRRHFLVLVQIIMKCLQQDNANSTAVVYHAKKVIRECTLRNQQGDPNFASLVDAATPRLRKVVGEKVWRRSILLLRHYMQQQKAQQQSKVVPI